MKKILLIVAVVLCVAVAGTALAVNYNSASNVTGTLKADSFLKLGLDNCSTTPITINPGTPEVYTIQCDVTNIQANEESPKTGTLTITLADAGSGQDLDDVTVALFTDLACTTPLKLDADNKVDASGTAVSITGADVITVAGISANATFYARISVPANLSEDDAEACAGSMTLAFVKAA